jgi:hypothetical protein
LGLFKRRERKRSKRTGRKNRRVVFVHAWPSHHSSAAPNLNQTKFSLLENLHLQNLHQLLKWCKLVIDHLLS